jgi:manganese/zinc/iron transport system ATP- binding protein
MDGFAPFPREDFEAVPHPPGPAPIAALEVENLTVRYGDKPAVEGVSARFLQGSMTAIIGPNGAGKSTLLKAALGLVSPAEGEARFFGRALGPMRQRIAYVPQRASVDWDFPARVRDVVTMGLYAELGLLSRLTGAQKARIAESLARLGITDLAERQIGQLSGGQQQRVFLARALVQDADLYLLDEPLAGVDAATEATIFAVLAALVATGKTVIAVHHDLSTVEAQFGRVLLINRRVIAEGPTREAFTDEKIARAYGGRVAR